MRALFSLALALGLCATGAARADDTRPTRVRTQVNVEVIDDARHVEDIISRMKSQPRTAAPEAGHPAAPEPGRAAAPERARPMEAAAPRPERPPLPEATREAATRPDKRDAHKVDRRTDRRADRAAAERHQGGRHRR